jgi:hypothetical protein
MFYADVDAVCKLANWNILQFLPELITAEWADIATISSLRHRIDQGIKKPDGKLFRSIQAAEVAKSCVALMSPLEAPDSLLLEHLVSVPQIDPGEAILLALAADDPRGVFITGDKRALRALASHPIAPKFAGKVLCLEQLVEACLKLKGRDWFLSHVCPFREIDKAVSIILGSQCDAALEHLHEGFQSYIAELRVLHAPPLLIELT